MAYRFDGIDDVVEFALGPFSGYSVAGWTMAMFINPISLGFTRSVCLFTDSTVSAVRIGIRTSHAVLEFDSGASAPTGPSLSTGTWYLLALTKATGTATPRWHLHDGSNWSHSNASGTAPNTTISSSDRLALGAYPGGGAQSNFDIVVVGIKKSDSADATIEALSRTSYSAWTSFGFDWLIAFDGSGIRNDQASPGTGDETSRTGTSLVSDPGGWAWTSATTWNGTVAVALTDTLMTSGKRTTRGSSALTETVAVTMMGGAAHVVLGAASLTETITVTTRSALPPFSLTSHPIGALALVPASSDAFALTPLPDPVR